jgi:DNA-directed RNA polymerase alpha subunit
LYKPLPDGSQPSPLIEDIDDLGRARGPLIAAGLRTLEEVLALTDAQLMSIKGIGAKSLLMIRILGEPAQQAA